MRNPFDVTQWIVWLAAVLAGTAGFVSFAYTAFTPAETHRRDIDAVTTEHRRDIDGVSHSLELMNGKLDDLLLRVPRQRK